jgi:hypothetical protein
LFSVLKSSPFLLSCQSLSFRNQQISSLLFCLKLSLPLTWAKDGSELSPSDCFATRTYL